jgi:HK97 family phage major capsid protein
MQNVQELKLQRNKILTDMSTLAGKPWTTESRTSFDKMSLAAEVLDGDIARAEQMAAIEVRQNDFPRSPRPGIGDGHSAGGADSKEEQRKKFNKAFQVYATRGEAGLNQEQRALLTTSDVTGGALVAQGFYPELVNALKFFGPIATKVRQKVTDNNGAPIKISLGNDTANGLVLLGTEGTSGPVETDPSFQSKTLGVDTVSGGLVKVSFQELADSEFDLGALIDDYFGKRYGRGIEKAIITGTDSAGTTLPNFTSGGLLGAATSAVTTASLSAGIGWTDIVSLFAALDPAYINANTSWVMNSTTRSALVAEKDGFGRPFWTPDPSGDGPFSKILGYDVTLAQTMPNMGVNATPIMFGDLKSSWLHRTDGAPSILRLNERYADTLEAGFMMFSRVGGISLNAGVTPLVKLTQAAS